MRKNAYTEMEEKLDAICKETMDKVKKVEDKGLYRVLSSGTLEK